MWFDIFWCLSTYKVATFQTYKFQAPFCTLLVEGSCILIMTWMVIEVAGNKQIISLIEKVLFIKRPFKMYHFYDTHQTDQSQHLVKAPI